jgi:hypothetical protein
MADGSARSETMGRQAVVGRDPNIMLLSPEERVHRAVQLFGLTEKFIERARNPIAGTPIEYDTGVRPLPPGKGRI